MASKYTHDLVATIGEYTNREGEKKKNYLNVGKAFTDEHGRVSLKLDALPVNPEWSGWISLYPIKDRDDRDTQPAQPRQQPVNRSIPSQRATTQGGAGAPPMDDDGDDFESSIPF